MDWSLQSLRLAAPEILLSLSGLVMLLASAWASWRQMRSPRPGWPWRCSSGPPMVAPALFARAPRGRKRWPSAGLFAADAFASRRQAADLCRRGGLVAGRACSSSNDSGRCALEYPVLVLFAVLGMSMMVSATNLLTLYIGLELNSLAAYVLAAFLKARRPLGRSGAQVLRAGLARQRHPAVRHEPDLRLHRHDETSPASLRRAFKGGLPDGRRLRALVFVLAGLAFKISAVPFHMWTPDVYEGAPTPVTTLFAIRAQGRGTGADDDRLRSKAFGTQAADAWQPIVIFAALASVVLGCAGRDRADQYQAPAGLFVDQQRRLPADRACHRHARPAPRPCWSILRSMSR
jgi:NADH-quinone oxidoreductase subunit N